jgi:hypothetical protein
MNELVAQTRAELLRAHFEIVHEEYGGVDGATILFERSVKVRDAMDVRVWIRLSGDRGHWSLAVRFSRHSPWIPPSVWESHLDGVPIRDPDLAADVKFVVGRLTEAAEATVAQSSIEAELDEAGRRYMSTRLGVAADGDPTSE